MVAAGRVEIHGHLQQEWRTELIAIADWWVTHSQDLDQGGFYGEIDAQNCPVAGASKGVILNTRILWFFSEVARVLDKPEYQQCARRAYDYLLAHFFDTQQGGVYWELDAAGQPLNTKKQIYAQAFAIYALCAYHQLTGEAEALTRALDCFALIERYGVDREREGYLEAFARDWSPLEDIRLSDKDLNFPKSQNTHLHVLEAYTSLYQVHPTTEVANALRYNIQLFDKYMIDKRTHHLRMFMDIDWTDHSPGFTYGHDIEASWLIARALDALNDAELTAHLTPTLIRIAEVTLEEAVGEQGQVLDAYDFASRQVSPANVWWVQAEALVGFLYAFTSTGDEKYFYAAEGVWRFIQRYQIDAERGEWLWLSSLDTSPAQAPYKLGFWKCPYHNGRAMIEAGRYLQLAK